MRLAPRRPVHCGRGARGTSGMTLVEVLVSMAILITGLIGIFALLNSGVQSHRRAINETESSLAAASVLAELRAQFFRGEVPKSDAKGVFTELPDYPGYEVNRAIIPLEPARRGVPEILADREYFVRVEIRWMVRGGAKSINVQSVMFRNKPERK